MGTESVEFCRELEAYLCKKNDGHLMRVTGPSFDLVASWAEKGIPLKVACAGIDRYFERYYRKGPRRRPVKIDFCEADILDVFDEWRKAIGATSDKPKGPSLPAHLERVLLKLTAARAGGKLGDEFDAIIDRVSRELDTARASAGGVRGEARQALLARLASLDAELLDGARAALAESEFAAMTKDAADEIESFRERMTAEAFARAKDGALSRLIRARFGLPTMAFL